MKNQKASRRRPGFRSTAFLLTRDLKGRDVPMLRIEYKVYPDQESMSRGIYNFEKRYVSRWQSTAFGDTPRTDNGVLACMIYLNKAKSYLKEKRGVAVLFFNRDQLGSGVVAHEISHVIFSAMRPLIKQFMRARQYSLRHRELSETIANLNEILVRSFWTWFYEHCATAKDKRERDEDLTRYAVPKHRLIEKEKSP